MPENTSNVLMIEVTSDGKVKVEGSVPAICQVIKENSAVIFGVVNHMRQLDAEWNDDKVVSRSVLEEKDCKIKELEALVATLTERK